MSRVEAQPGWVLHRRSWRESSLLIEFFGRTSGRIGLVARAARSARSPWRGVAEPFCPLLASWTRRGEMGTLTGLESTGPRRVLTGRVLWCGLYANELLIKLLARDDPAPTVFDAYDELLEALAAMGSAGPALRRFELKLLAGMGVAPDFDRDAGSGEPINPDKLYHLAPEAGFVAVDRPGRAVFAGTVIQDLARDRESGGDQARMARLLTRQLIDYHLGGHPLQTRRLFETAHRKGDSP